MTKLPLCVLIFALTCYDSLSEHVKTEVKTIDKRQSCSGGNCDGTGGTIGGGYPDYLPPRPCPGGNCGGNGGGYPDYLPPRPCVGGNCGGNGGGYPDYLPPRPCPGGNCGGNGGYTIPDPNIYPIRPRPCPGCGGYRPCTGRNCGNEEWPPYDVRDFDWSGTCRGGSCNCCYVMHPKQCYTDENGDKRCLIRRHRECSDLCTSSVVSIQEGTGSRGRGCHYIQNYPYAYCGDYERYDCGQCYKCGGRYQPSECQRRKECPDGCRI